MRIATLSITDPIWTDLEVKLDLRGRPPRSNVKLAVVRMACVNTVTNISFRIEEDAFLIS